MPHIGRCRLAIGVAVVVATLGLLMPAESTAADGDEAGPGCRFLDVPLPTSVLDQQPVPVIGPGLLAGQEDLPIYGRLCLPDGHAPKTVMLALHGSTYNNTYWNSDFEPETYNFSRAMTDAGYAVFSIDRLGYGGSPRLMPELLSLDVHAEVTHQLIGRLRAGEVGGEAFEHVILVGHSYGTATAWRESAEHNDADAIIGTGWSNSVTPVPTAEFLSSFYPAQLDQKFAGRNLPPGYLTTRPGTRDGRFFYAPGGFDPDVVEYDQDVLRDAGPDGEGVGFAERFGAVSVAPRPGGSEDLEVPISDQTKQITIPTFQVVGEKELMFCGTDQYRCTSSQRLQRDESRFFTERACLRSAVTPDAGHILNFHRNARFTYASVRTFADEALGPDGSRKESYRKSCADISGTNVDRGPARF